MKGSDKKKVCTNKQETTTCCLRDYKNKHYWESIGTIQSVQGIVRQVFKCSQCHKMITEKLVEITKVYQVPKEFQK